MFTRIVIIMLIVVLALPITTLTRPAETSQTSWGEVAVAAKGKKHKKAKPPKTTAVTRTERQTVTQTFTSTAKIDIPSVGSLNDKGQSNPYPSAIEVSGFTNGTITDVNLILTDLTHGHYDDLDVLLSASDGRRALVMSDAGDVDVVPDIDLTLDDEAAAAMPGENEELLSGTFRPTNLDRSADNGPDAFAAPAPAPDGNVALSTFDGADPNGTWQVWVMDNNVGDVGELGGWALQITAETDVQVEEPVQAKAKQHKKKHKKRR